MYKTDRCCMLVMRGVWESVVVCKTRGMNQLFNQFARLLVPAPTPSVTTAIGGGVGGLDQYVQLIIVVCLIVIAVNQGLELIKQVAWIAFIIVPIVVVAWLMAMYLPDAK
jgi:hypothetical protein